MATGCSTSKDGTPSPAADTGPSTRSQTESQNGAPKVADPIEAGRFVSNPCLALTSEQAKTLGATKPGKKETTGTIAETAGPSCDWHNSDNLTSFSLGFLTGNENGLADLYLGNKQGDFAYFEPVRVDGYPGVYASNIDARDAGNCGLNIGISEKLHFLIVTQGYEGKADSCGAARDVASAALKTMKGGG